MELSCQPINETKGMAMKLEKAKIEDLVNDPANVRKHDERNIDAIRASLQRFGQQKPIVVDGKGVVVAGNGTLMAAKSLGWKDIGIVRTELVGADAIAYAIADNRIAELAVWDDAALAKTLAQLQNDDSIDETITGFNEQDIEGMLGEFAVDIAEMPELADGEKDGFEQITFMFTDEQCAFVKQMLEDAIAAGNCTDETNTSKNANALVFLLNSSVYADQSE